MEGYIGQHISHMEPGNITAIKIVSLIRHVIKSIVGVMPMIATEKSIYLEVFLFLKKIDLFIFFPVVGGISYFIIFIIQ